MQIVYALLIGLAAGWLAGLLMRRKGFGLLGNLVLGVIGSVLGSFVFGMLGLRTANTFGALVTATVGAVLTLLIVGLIFNKKR